MKTSEVGGTDYKVGKRYMVPMGSVRNEIFVRERLDSDRVDFFYSLLEGETFPAFTPLLVTSELLLVDGRHRLEAYSQHRTKEIEVHILCGPEQDKAKLLSKAFVFNMEQGPLPPTPGDFKFTIRQFFAIGWNKTKVYEELVSAWRMDKKVASIYVRDAYTNIQRDKKRRVAAKVLKGDVSLEEAAKEEGIDARSVKEFMGGKINMKEFLNSAKGQVANKFKGVNLSLGQSARNLTEQWEIDEVTGEQVLDILAFAQEVAEDTARQATDRVNRFAERMKLKKETVAK